MGLPSLFYGAVINPESLISLQALPCSLIYVGLDGIIEWMIPQVSKEELSAVLTERGLSEPDVVVLQDGEFLMPGFIDTHTHAVQFPTIGTGGQDQLLDWLSHTIFPGEVKFFDTDYARRVFKSVVRRTLDCGTTTACYYSSIHPEATKVLADIVHDHGQRAFVGKCNMDNPKECPSYLVEPSWETSLQDTITVINHIRKLSGDLVQPILSPRFAISCTPELLTALGKYANREENLSLRIQTHFAENLKEVHHTKELFKDSRSYADVYNDFRLLRHNTILGHGVHVTDHELFLIREKRAGIAHCPSSNLFLRSGAAPIGHYLDMGVKVGLATDVSGGSSASMLDNIQEASKISKSIIGDKPTSNSQFADNVLSIETLLYLATLGGADLCDMKDEIGSFAPGKKFDAILVNTCWPGSGPDLWIPEDIGIGERPLRARLERFLFCGDDRNIVKVWVQGRLVKGASIVVEPLNVAKTL